MERTMEETASPVLRAFVTLILKIAGSKMTPVGDGPANSDRVQPTDRTQALEALSRPVSCEAEKRPRLLMLGPFLTLILTLRCRRAEGDGARWPESRLRGRAAGNA